MTSELKNRDDGRQALAVTADWPEVAADYEDLLSEYSKLAVPGFRPGKAPHAVIEHRFRQEICNDFTSRCGRRLAREALHERQVRAAGRLSINSIHLEPHWEFSFTAEFVPVPKLELPDYTAMPLAGRTDEERRDEISEWLLAHTPGEVPDALVRQECDPGSAEWPAAARRVKLTLVLEQIAETEGLEVDPRDVDARIGKVAAENGMPSGQLRRKLEREDGVNRLRSLLRAERTLEFLLSGAPANSEEKERHG